MSETVAIAILDYNRPIEGQKLLESIKENAQFRKDVIYLCNGGENNYAYRLYNEGFIDTLIIKKDNDGGGFGQTDLFNYCSRYDYTMFVQNDQYLRFPIKQENIDYFIKLLNNDFHMLDLSGAQAGKGTWSDRAHLINTKFFNSLGPFPNGGPGRLHHLRWNENYLQEVFRNNNYRIAHIEPFAFADNGAWSERTNPDLSQWRHRCDLKTTYLIKGPVKEKYIYPPFSDSQWEQIIKEQECNGIVPKEWENNVFRCWPD